MRVDTHIYNQYLVPPFYDSLLAKLIVHAENRPAALARLRRALAEFVVEGCKTNLDFFRRLSKRRVRGRQDGHAPRRAHVDSRRPPVLTKKDKHLAAAQKFLERGQEDRALEEFARVVQEDASDTRTWLKMAEIHAQRGALDEARDIYLRTAEIYSAQGFLHKAITVYKSVLKLMPGLPHVRERLAETYRQLGLVADAMHELELRQRAA